MCSTCTASHREGDDDVLARLGADLRRSERHRRKRGLHAPQLGRRRGWAELVRLSGQSAQRWRLEEDDVARARAHRHVGMRNRLLPTTISLGSTLEVD